MFRALARTTMVWTAVAALGCTGSIPNDGIDEGGGKAGSGGSARGAGRGGSAGSGGITSGEAGSGVVLDPSKPVVRNPSLDLACPANAGVRPGPSPLARLTNLEYANTIRDLFGGAANVMPNDLPAEVISGGFNNDAVSQTPSALLAEQLETAAGTIAAAAVDKLVTCTPASAADEATCLDGLLAGFGKRAFRRPLTTAEIGRIKTAFTNARKSDDFKTSVRVVVQGMLQAPQFVYKVEVGGNSTTGPRKLTGYELASRLSYLLWDTMPDAELFRAAEAGELDNADGVAKQAARLLADGKGKAAVGEFLSQWMELDRLDKNIGKKDAKLFPKYVDATMAGLRDGNRRFLDYVMWEKGGNLKTLLTDRTAFVNDATAFVYGAANPGSATALKPITMDSATRAGLLSQAGVLAGFAHETLQAPILRGIFVLDRLLCQPPPPAPPNVNTTLPSTGTSGPTTLRQRIVTLHEQGSCKSCHVLIDNVGFALENFDAIGQYRTKEEGLDVDSSASITGTYDANGSFKGATALADKLAGSEQVSECVAVEWFRYAMGRALDAEDGCAIAQLTNGLVDSKGDMQALLVSLTKTDNFRYRAAIAR